MIDSTIWGFGDTPHWIITLITALIVFAISIFIIIWLYKDPDRKVR
jgi:hypothetical protein